MSLHITHPEVRKLIERCEREVRELTGNPTVAISFVDNTRTMDLETIVAEVSKISKVPLEDIISQSRVTECVQARQLIGFFARKYCKISLSEIGRQLGDRDHTTIMSNIKRLTALMDSGDKRICPMVKKVNRRLKELLEDGE